MVRENLFRFWKEVRLILWIDYLFLVLACGYLYIYRKFKGAKVYTSQTYKNIQSNVVIIFNK